MVFFFYETFKNKQIISFFFSLAEKLERISTKFLFSESIVDIICPKMFYLYRYTRLCVVPGKIQSHIKVMWGLILVCSMVCCVHSQVSGNDSDMSLENT